MIKKYRFKTIEEEIKFIVFFKDYIVMYLKQDGTHPKATEQLTDIIKQLEEHHHFLIDTQSYFYNSIMSSLKNDIELVSDKS